MSKSKFSMGSFGDDNKSGGLLNESGKQLINDFQIKYIPIEELVPNEKNEGFSLDDIEELQDSIKDIGLEQNLVVMKVEEDKYKILSGHRRFEALKELVADGVEKFKTVPCTVKNLDKIDLPLTDEQKEIYAIATTNAEVRNNTDSDKLKLMKMLSEVYDVLKKNGHTGLGRRREFIAEKLGVSPRTVQTYKNIDENLSDEYTEMFKKDQLTLGATNELSKLPKDNQKELLEETKDVRELTEKEIKEYAKKVGEAKKKNEIKITHNFYTLNQKDFEYINDINSEISQIKNGITVNGKEWEKLKAVEKQITKQQKVIAKIFEDVRKRHTK